MTASRADVLSEAADIVAKTSAYMSGSCASCGHRREDHMGTIDGVKIGCTGSIGHCYHGEDEYGCMRFRSLQLYLNDRKKIARILRDLAEEARCEMNQSDYD